MSSLSCPPSQLLSLMHLFDDWKIICPGGLLHLTKRFPIIVLVVLFLRGIRNSIISSNRTKEAKTENNRLRTTASEMWMSVFRGRQKKHVAHLLGLAADLDFHSWLTVWNYIRCLFVNQGSSIQEDPWFITHQLYHCVFRNASSIELLPTKIAYPNCLLFLSATKKHGSFKLSNIEKKYILACDDTRRVQLPLWRTNDLYTRTRSTVVLDFSFCTKLANDQNLFVTQTFLFQQKLKNDKKIDTCYLLLH